MPGIEPKRKKPSFANLVLYVPLRRPLPRS